MRCSTLFSPRRRPLINAICSAATGLHILNVAIPFSILPVASAAGLAEGTVWATPHSQYSSSVGVLGCKVNTNRVAYWPASIDCDNICISLSHEGRTVHLLRVDQSEGAYDISYDAWNYLVTGESARSNPTAGGAVAMEYKEAKPSDCADLIKTSDGKLPLSASNSMNYLASCLDQSDSWVAKNYALYNILDPICSWGHDEVCTLDWPTANQAACASGLGVPSVLTTTPVYNIEYPTGRVLLASTGQAVNNTPSENTGAIFSENSGGLGRRGIMSTLTFWTASSWLLYAAVLSL